MLGARLALPAPANPFPFLRRREARVFAFYSNRVGCLGSIVVSIIGTIVLIVLVRLLSA